jgi:hypothetical protein
VELHFHLFLFQRRSISVFQLLPAKDIAIIWLPKPGQGAYVMRPTSGLTHVLEQVRPKAVICLGERVLEYMQNPFEAPQARGFRTPDGVGVAVGSKVRHDRPL